MLIKCVECELKISDKALACPHCGYPMINPDKIIKKYSKTKRKRLPNGFGQISEIKNKNLRKPFRAMISIGTAPNGRPISKPLKPVSYFKTYNEAYFALMEYNKNPYDFSSDITMEELYKKWSSKYFENTVSPSGKRGIEAAWLYCSSIYKIKVCQLRIRHIKSCIEDGEKITNGVVHKSTPAIKNRNKSTINIMLDYAVEQELIDRNISRTLICKTQVNKNYKGHIPFTENEIQILWDNLYKIPFIDVLLIQCYSGWRPQELGLIKMENVNINQWCFTGGMKTKYGADRMVPIHTKIRPLVLKLYNQSLSLNSEYLITDSGAKNTLLKYQKYYQYFNIIITNLNLNPDHRPHDGRVYFVTSAKKANMDEYAIKYIVGHSINDITEKIYTKRNPKWLYSEIEKIK